MPMFKDWLMKHESVFKASCKLCSKSIDLSNMGKRALTSHAQSKKHKKAVDRRLFPSMQMFVKSETKTSGDIQESQPHTSKEDPMLSIAMPLTEDKEQGKNTACPESHQPLLKSYAVTDDVMRAEILWALKAVKAHFSFNSSEEIGKLFRTMFPDSAIAKKFACGRTKINYMICFGIAPYFREKLLHSIQEAECFTVSFDESLNKESQSEQMDIIVQYFHVDKVVSHYYDSQFMGHTTAKDLVLKFKSGLSKLNPGKILQISMDGPNVNWKFYSLICEDRNSQDADLPKLLNIGSCGLHVVHGAFCTGAQSTGWKLDGFLRALWYLFHDSPARREDYTTLTESTTFPLKFCATRWVEDEKIAQRALEIWPNVEKYMKHVLKGQFKSKQPTSASFSTIQKAIQDPLIVAKLQVFVHIAKVLKPLLVKYQTEQPMIMFLAEDLYDVCHKLMLKFLKTSVLESADTVYKIANLKVLESNNHKQPSDIDIGFATKAILSNLIKAKSVSERAALEFRMECLQFLSKLTDKILEKSPMKYRLVRSLICLNPKKMVTVPNECSKAFEVVLCKLVEAKWRTNSDSDDLLEQYRDFLQFVKREHSTEFLECQERIDSFLYGYLNDKKEFQLLWKVFKLLLTISHGQSTVERGFCINSDAVTTNLLEETLVSLRTVYDSVKSMGQDLSDFAVTKELLMHCR